MSEKQADQNFKNRVLQSEQSEFLFKNILNKSQDLICIVGMDGYFKYTNPAWEKIIGYTESELLSKPIFDFMHSDDHKISADEIEKLMTGQYAIDFENRYIHKDGSIRRISWMATPDPETQLIYCIGRDITRQAQLTKELDEHRFNLEDIVKRRTLELQQEIIERKQAEESLQESRSKLLRAQYIAKLGDFTWDISSGAATWSEGMYRLLKYDLNENIDYAKVNSAIHHPDDLESVTKWLKESIASGKEKIIPKEYRLVCKDGEILEVHTEGQIEYKNGEAVKLFGTCQDITERNRTEQALRDEKNFIDMAIDSLPGIFYLFSREGKFLRWNKNFEKVSEYSTDEISTMHPRDFFPVEEQALVEKRIGEVFTKGESFVEAHWLSKSGVKTFYYLTGVRVEIGGTLCQVGMGIDISKRKQAEKIRDKLQTQLIQSQKMESIGNLAGGIAHDFNNLLFPIIGMAEMLLEDLPQDSPEHENAQEIFHAGRRAGELVNQILAFSRQSEHKMTPVRVQNVLKEVLKLSRSTIPINIEIQQNIQQNCGSVMADTTQIHQVAMNLITNAYHAVEVKNGVIGIELKEIIIEENELPDKEVLPGKYVRLSVSDSGIGMAQSTINKIFEPYFTTKEKGKGTGLGLAVVYGIVKEHKGDIKIYSELGKGTTFNVYLPLMKKSSEIATVDTVARAVIGTERILLVDDEVSVAKLEGQMLSRLGYQVTVKTNSGDALNAFRSNPDSFDIVMSDMTMPDMTGDQLSKEILLIKPETPIIICTGFSERINKEQAEAIGVKGFLMKPVAKSEMVQMVRKVLDEAKV